MHCCISDKSNEYVAQKLLPMKAVNHFELPTQVLLGEMIEHPCVNQTLHECCSVLGKTESGQPGVADPLVVHVTKGQCRPRSFRG